MKPSDGKRSKRSRFGICINDDHFHLQARKVYRILPDAVAEKYDYVRVVDDSQEDYVYPREGFVFVDLPRAVQQLVPDVPSRTVRRRKSSPHQIGAVPRPSSRRRAS